MLVCVCIYSMHRVIHGENVYYPFMCAHGTTIHSIRNHSTENKRISLFYCGQQYYNVGFRRVFFFFSSILSICLYIFVSAVCVCHIQLNWTESHTPIKCNIVWFMCVWISCIWWCTLNLEIIEMYSHIHGQLLPEATNSWKKKIVINNNKSNCSCIAIVKQVWWISSFTHDVVFEQPTNVYHSNKNIVMNFYCIFI